MFAFCNFEAEYIAAGQTLHEAIWLRSILQKSNTALDVNRTPLFKDRQAAIIVAENRAETNLRKFFDLRYHHLTHYIITNRSSMTHIASVDRWADYVTKATPFPRSLDVFGIEP